MAIPTTGQTLSSSSSSSSSAPESLCQFRFPADWESAEAIWLAWPHNRETWPGRFDNVPAFFAKLARMIAESTPVKILARDEVATAAEQEFGALPVNVDLVPIQTNDCWIRDYGPLFVENSQTKRIEAVDWRYNAWGGKYPPWDLDGAAAKQICHHLGIPCHESQICLEGGALETDGTGRILTFESCLLAENRNPKISQQEIIQELYHRLGVLEIAWIDGGGLDGDDTDGHIDQLARFVDQENVVVASCIDTNDFNAAGLIANYRKIDMWSQVTEPGVTVHRLPIPPARYINETRVPESYCNFLRIGPDRMLVPQFGDQDADHRALGILKDLCPKTDVTGVDCRDLVWGLGALHCASLNQPKIG